MANKDRVLRGCNQLAARGLLEQYVLDGTVTIEELELAGLSPDNVAALREKTRARLEADENAWSAALNAMSVDAFNNYLNAYPKGNHAFDARKMLEDAPWLTACQVDTVQAYENYLQMNPGKHDQECFERINTLNEKTDYLQAKEDGTITALQHFLDIHPQSVHCSEIRNRLKQLEEAATQVEELMNNLTYDKSSCSVSQLKAMLDSKLISRNDLFRLGYTDDQINALYNFQGITTLPPAPLDRDLPNGYTEVYFWGTPGSGKTCTLGAILSAANCSGRLEHIYQGNGLQYYNQLQEIFRPNSVCILPGSTDNMSIMDSVIGFRDKDKKIHKACVIDLAGEVFDNVYMLRSGQMRTGDLPSLDAVMHYLGDKRNRKIHFFLVPYGDHNVKAGSNNLSIDRYLTDMTTHLHQNNIFKNHTDGIYILVTKCDRIPCPRQERAQNAFEYVQNYYPSFYNNLLDACHKYSIRDFAVINFSLGDVFAREMCNFDPSDSLKIIDKICQKTKVERGGLFGFLNN